MPRGSRSPSDVFKVILRNAEADLALASKKATGFQYSGIRGDERSAALIEFLRSHLPGTFGVGKGEVIDYQDRRSGQLDIVVYDKNASAPVFSGHENLLIPCEALYAVIEVKTLLSQDELDMAYAAAQKVRRLRPFKKHFIGPRKDGVAVTDENCRCAYSVFSYNSNLSKENWLQKEFARIKAAANKQNAPAEVVERVVVLGRGMINPCNAYGKVCQGDDESIFLEYYLHLVNFLNRESTRRPAVDWQVYSGRTASGWVSIQSDC